MTTAAKISLRSALILLLAFCPGFIAAANPQGPTAPAVVNADVSRFWSTYDRVRDVTDPAERTRLLQTLYIEPGSDGLIAFLEVKGCTAEKYADLLHRYPRYWASIRSRSESSINREVALQPELAKLHALYPATRPAAIYFLVGCMTSGGTTQGDKVLIGTELAMGDPEVDISELPERTQNWLRGYFATRPAEQLALLNVHEYVHTQQRGPGQTLLAQALYEGAADFIAEQVTGRLPALAYAEYGPAHLQEIKAKFAAEMNQADYSAWLYNSNGNSAFGVGDLGYFMGYMICQAYYERAADKQEAIRKIIELDYTHPNAATDFLNESGFYP